MSQQCVGSNARFERASTGSWLTVTTADLAVLIEDYPDDEDCKQLDGNTWHAIGLELFPGFELVTWGNDV